VRELGYANIYIPLTLYPRRGSSSISDIPSRRFIGISDTSFPTFYQNELAMRDTADETGGKSFVVRLQSISGGNPVNRVVAFYDIYRTLNKVKVKVNIVYSV
jgi:hypothetical protein